MKDWMKLVLMACLAVGSFGIVGCEVDDDSEIEIRDRDGGSFEVDVDD